MKKISYISEIFAFHTIPPAVSESILRNVEYFPHNRVPHRRLSRRKVVLLMARPRMARVEWEFHGNRFSFPAGTFFESTLAQKCDFSPCWWQIQYMCVCLSLFLLALRVWSFSQLSKACFSGLLAVTNILPWINKIFFQNVCLNISGPKSQFTDRLFNGKANCYCVFFIPVAILQ